jgi:hypothetical protein
MWKKCSRKSNEHVSEWNPQAKEIIEQQNQRRIERFVELHKAWFKPNTGKFSGRVAFEKKERTRLTSNFARPSRWRDVYEQRVDIKNSGEKSNDSGDNGFEAIVPISKGTFKPHNSCFGGEKQRDNQYYEANNL